MAMNVYHVLEFLSGLSVSKMAERANQDSKRWLFFSIFIGLSTFTEFLKVKLLINITTLRFLLNSVKE